jgi:AAA domain
VRDLTAEKSIAAFVGPSGTGKSFAAAVALELDCSIDIASLAVPSRRLSELDLLRSLLGELTGVRYSAPFADLLREAREALAGPPRLLVVEKAEHLTRHTLGVLSTLFDDPSAAVSLVVVGTEDCLPVVKRLGFRVAPWVSFAPLGDERLVETLRRYHPLLEASEEDVLRLVDSNFAHGRLGQWAAFTRAALREQPSGELTRDGALRALARLGQRITRTEPLAA